MNASLAQLDVSSILHPQTDPLVHESRGPLIIESGHGVWVKDADGNEYLEGMASLWCATLGFSNKELADAAARQFAILPTYHTFNHRSNLPSIELSQELLDISPIPQARVAYANSGGEANETMIKLTWMYQAGRGLAQKRKIICRQNAYHGATTLTSAMSGLGSVRGSLIPVAAEVIFTDSPDAYKHARHGQSKQAYLDQCLDNLEALIEREGADTIAAMIVEPVSGAGGVVIPTVAYYRRLAAILKRNDILLLCDEVITGFGRTGNWFGCQTFEFTPDMMSVAKGLSSGYVPIGATLVADEIYRVVAQEAHRVGIFGHGFTYAGHPVTSAVACEALRIYKRIGLVDRVRQLSIGFLDRLRQLEAHPLVGEARGCGLVGALELVADKESRRGFDKTGEVGALVLKSALAHGLIIRNLGDVIAICPPMIITETELDELFCRLALALNDVAESMGVNRKVGEEHAV